MERLNKTSLFFLIAFSGLCFQAFGQPRSLENLVTNFDRYRKNNLQEKIYLHTDRDFYVTGETLWFKLYNVDGAFHHPLDISKIAYIEILDNQHISILQSKVSIAQGSGSGSIFIPASLTSANYILRAYTRWMKNFAPEFYFEKTISIVNPFVKPDVIKAVATRKNNVSVAFFPEGGHLVKGLKSKVAFKVSEPDGKGVSCRVSIVSPSGDTLSDVRSDKHGLGNFYFIPESAQGAKAVVHLPGGTKSSYTLPPAQENGYVMTVKDSTEKWIRVEARASWKNSAPSYVYLFVHARHAIVHAEAMSAHAAIFNIDKAKMKDGISHITLFDGEMKPVCERLFFKKPEKVLDIALETDQKQYGVRRKVKVTINTSAEKEKHAANLSMAVFKLDSLGAQRNENISTFLLLTSDLQGTIEDAAFYFEGDDRKEAIDNLMLTHGWRRFRWDDLTKTDSFRLAPEYRGHLITGNVKTLEGKPVTGVITYLSSPDKVVRIYPSVSDSQGRVQFEARQFPGSRRLIVQSASDSSYKIQIDNPYSEKFGSYHAGRLMLEPSMEKALVARTIAMQVQDIYVENIRERYSAQEIDSVGFYGHADETYLLDEYTRFPVMEEVMREYVPGVIVRKKRDGFHFIVLDMVHKTVMRENPLILLDGVPVLDADEIMAFDPRKVRKLEVVKRPYFLGPASFPGIVSYTTYNGDLAGFQLDPETVQLDYEGIQVQREFYKPFYESQAQRAERNPDLRNLLYWNPQIVTDKDGQAQFDFFTSDIEGQFMIVTEGITEAGQPGSSRYTFTVKRFDN
jgi:hypothetical protein